MWVVVGVGFSFELSVLNVQVDIVAVVLGGVGCDGTC